LFLALVSDPLEPLAFELGAAILVAVALARGKQALDLVTSKGLSR